MLLQMPTGISLSMPMPMTMAMPKVNGKSASPDPKKYSEISAKLGELHFKMKSIMKIVNFFHYHGSNYRKYAQRMCRIVQNK